MAKPWTVLIICGCVVLLLMILAACSVRHCVITLPDSGEQFTNPLIGYAPKLNYPEQLNEDSRLIYMQILWSELEPEEGVYDWERLETENCLSLLRRRGVHLVIRFICDYPGREEHMDIPQWLYEKTGDGSHYQCSYGAGYSPNYANPVFIQAHAAAVAALGEHFGGDTLVSYVELGSIGHWGEWHVNYSAGIPRLPGAAIREKYITPWMDAFPNARLLMRRPFAPARELGLGVYNDMAGHPEATQEWLQWIEEGGVYDQTRETNAVVPMPEVWNTAPVGGELTSSIPMERMLTTELSTTLDWIRRSHMSFIGPKIAEKDYLQGYNAVESALGYRICVPEISVIEFFGQSILLLTWENTGAAPMYWDWPIHLYLTDKDGNTRLLTDVELDLRTLLPDNTRTVTRSFLPGTKLWSELHSGSSLSLGITDPMTGKDCVRLASACDFSDGRNILFF